MTDFAPEAAAISNLWLWNDDPNLDKPHHQMESSAKGSGVGEENIARTSAVQDTTKVLEDMK
eukprot:2137950-Amphidinium_carterae.1